MGEETVRRCDDCGKLISDTRWTETLGGTYHIGHSPREQLSEARRQLAGAAEAVRLLLRLVKAIPTDYWPNEWGKAYDDLPAWMRKEIER